VKEGEKFMCVRDGLCEAVITRNLDSSRISKMPIKHLLHDEIFL
jgi:hypothetical protein